MVEGYQQGPILDVGLISPSVCQRSPRDSALDNQGTKGLQEEYDCGWAKSQLVGGFSHYGASSITAKRISIQNHFLLPATLGLPETHVMTKGPRHLVLQGGLPFAAWPEASRHPVASFARGI